MTTHPTEAKPAFISKTSQTQHSQDQRTRDRWESLPDHEVPTSSFPEPKAEDLATLTVDREWIAGLRAAAARDSAAFGGLGPGYIGVEAGY